MSPTSSESGFKKDLCPTKGDLFQVFGGGKVGVFGRGWGWSTGPFTFALIVKFPRCCEHCIKMYGWVMENCLKVDMWVEGFLGASPAPRFSYWLTNVR